MDSNRPQPLVGAEIHGFLTTADLDVEKLMEEAASRWFRPNEVHAILSNHAGFKIQPQPVHLPASGSVLLFDRKMLRNFRKDGYNWKKKKDGKTVQEAHEKLKVGTEERIHVYYARGEDDHSFYRRCYWLLDKNSERIVLVHYRHTAEESMGQCPPASVEHEEDLPFIAIPHNNSPIAPLDSISGSSHSDMSSSVALSEETDSQCNHEIYIGSGTSQVQKYDKLKYSDLIIHDINTLEWTDLLEEPVAGGVSVPDQPNPHESETFPRSMSAQKFECHLESQIMDGNISSCISNDASGNVISINNQTSDGCYQIVESQQIASSFSKSRNGHSTSSDLGLNPVDGDKIVEFKSQDSLSRWDSLGSYGDLQLDNQFLNRSRPDSEGIKDQPSTQEQLFCITEISPAWGYSSEETKVLLIGSFHESQNHLAGTNIYCMVGGVCVATEMIHSGVYRFMALPHPPGLVDLYLTFNGRTPISQVLSFDYRSTSQSNSQGASLEDKSDEIMWKDFLVQMRLAHLLFSTTDHISILSSRIKSINLKEAKKYASLTSPSLENDWIKMLKLSDDNKASVLQASQGLFELILRNKLQEWLLEKVLDGCKTTPRDAQGQGAIHLCAILDYVWAIRLFLQSGMSLDFRDASGWTALHWAASFGREKMVAALLSAGANPSLVTDPTPEYPGGCTAADLACREGYEGLGAYLAEKGLAAHFQAMSLSGNASAPVTHGAATFMIPESAQYENLTEQELCLKDSLAAYRNAADAADRIQAAFRERSLKLQTKAIQSMEPELEAAMKVAALKIQHAFQNYRRRKMLKAAARIQGYFRTWQARKNFLNMRKQAIKIQSAFRAYQARRQYCKIIWSVGILEKAVLRWRLKKKGLRGINSEQTDAMKEDKEEENTVEEDFFRVSREQAEERVRRSVVRVQCMFRSYRAQQEYRRMKLAHEQAKLEFGELNGN